jgi:beta-glucosidase-like glycosyl hydrolase
MVAPVVKGIQAQGVIANVKHFVNNNQEHNRGEVSVIVDERTEWEIYFLPFHAAIEAGALSVMCSYNKINGTCATLPPFTDPPDIQSASRHSVIPAKMPSL